MLKLSSYPDFSSGDQLFAFTGGFFGLKCFPNSLTKHMSAFFKSQIQQGSALGYIDDLLVMSHPKPYMLQLPKEIQYFARRKNLN